MSTILIICITLISYMQAWSFSQYYDLKPARFMIFIFVLLFCGIKYIWDIYAHERKSFLSERVLLIFFATLAIVLSVQSEKFYLLIPLIIGIIVFNIPIAKILYKLCAVYMIFFFGTVLLSFIGVNNQTGLWGFYHANVASGYVVGVQVILALISAYSPPKRNICTFVSFLLVLLSILASSSAGVIVGLCITFVAFYGHKIKIARHPILLICMTIFPLAMTYLLISIYRISPLGVGGYLNRLLSSRLFIWDTTLKTFNLQLFPREEAIVFDAGGGYTYTMPIDSIYISIPVSCGIVFFGMLLSLFYLFSLLSLKQRILTKKEEGVANVLFCLNVIMLIYGIVEVHAVEYQVNPLIFIIVIYLYKFFQTKKQNVFEFGIIS